MLLQASAQTLAHPGWVGNGLNTDAWWQHAVFYEPPATATQPDFKAIAAKLYGLRALGADAVLIPTPEIPSLTQPSTALEDFDELIHQASRNGIRILLDLSVSATTPDVPAVTRFWLSRGIAGFRVTTAPGMSQPESDAIVQSVRRLAASAPGQRIVISDLDPAATPPSTRITGRRAGRTPDGQPQIDPRPAHLATLEAATLRPLLDQTITQPTLLLDLPTATLPGHLANAIAAMQLTLHPVGLIDADLKIPDPPQPEPIAAPTPAAPPPPQALPPGTYVPYVPYVPPPKPAAVPQETPLADPLTDWYRQLAVLHHANAVLRLGATTLLNFDQQNALVWVARPATSSPLTPPVAVLCNLSSEPVQIALGAAVKNLNLHGTYLRTILRSDKAMGPQDLNAVLLPPYAVYIGELRR